MIKSFFKLCFRSIRNNIYYFGLNRKKCENEILIGELIRATHTIEKGLTITNKRPYYGKEKIMYMLTILERLKDKDIIKKYNYALEAYLMGISSLKAYILWHEDNLYNCEYIEKIKNRVSHLPNNNVGTEIFGGVDIIKVKELCFNKKEIEKLFLSRHSVREFSGEHVNIQDLKEALELAKRAPSACNRQAFRVYVLSHDNSRELSRNLSEIGGFAENVDRYIIITGKTSAYRYEEDNQYIVSAAIYAGYLSLTLWMYNIGNVIIQRSVVFNKEWKNMQNIYNIPKDEQMICLIGIGMLKDCFMVPKSYRMKNDDMVVFIDG